MGALTGAVESECATSMVDMTANRAVASSV